MPAPRPPTAAEPEDSPASNSRPASLWPDTGRLPETPSRFDGASHFDPLHEQAGRSALRLADRFALCRPGLALRVLLALQLGVALASLPAAQGPLDWALSAVVLAFAALAGGLVWLPAVCSLQRVLPRWRAPWPTVVVSLLGALAALVGWGLVALLGLVPAQPWSALAAAACGLALAAAVWSWLALRAAAAVPVHASARLAELQSRIRPHFLFNALNTALALVRVDPENAETVLEDLSQLFRAALAEAGASVSLADEIELARRYLAIEKLRFGARLQLAWDLDPAASAVRLPPLVLQPLVENAVRHGVEPAARGGRIRVSTRLRRGMVEIRVSNTLPARSERPGRPGTGMALANVRERLRLLHDVAATLDAAVEGELFEACIRVPS
jgi:two-component system, LytTR family, sensor histidine kinase AlgZ